MSDPSTAPARPVPDPTGRRGEDCGWRRHDVCDLIAAGALEINDGYRAKNDELTTAGLPFARAGNVRNGFQFAGVDRLPPTAPSESSNRSKSSQ